MKGGSRDAGLALFRRSRHSVRFRMTAACRLPCLHLVRRGLPLLFCLLLAGGCSHYQLGTGSRISFQTVYIEPVTNRTLLPQAQALLSTQLRQEFSRDGRVALANSAGSAEATLTVVIVDYHRDVAAVREDDTGLARKFNLTLGVICTLRDNRTGAILFEQRPIAAVREAFTDGGQLQSEYQTLPVLASALARKIVHATLDVW